MRQGRPNSMKLYISLPLFYIAASVNGFKITLYSLYGWEGKILLGMANKKSLNSFRMHPNISDQRESVRNRETFFCDASSLFVLQNYYSQVQLNNISEQSQKLDMEIIDSCVNIPDRFIAFDDGVSGFNTHGNCVIAYSVCSGFPCTSVKVIFT